MERSILIFGAGNMGASLARGLKASQGFGDYVIRMHDQHADRLLELEKELGIKVAQDFAQASPTLLPDDAIVLCIKPADLPTVGQMLAGRIKPQSLVISILAGITIADVQAALSFGGPIVRSMPNIAATVQAAATAMCCSDHCGEEQKRLAERIFGSIGEADWTKESLMDAVTGLSGSGPAYLYMVIEALTDGGVKMGIPRALAARLATQTVLGSAMLVKETGLHPAILREQVTTPGGTTITAIHELEDRGLRAMLISAVETATKRSKTLRVKKK